jgi:hypothetical protein
VQRVRHAAAMTARMQILRRCGERELEPAESTARHGERRLVDPPHRAVADTMTSAARRSLCCCTKASRWRLPISSSPSNRNLDVDGQAASRREERLGHRDRNQHRPLVVGHAAA